MNIVRALDSGRITRLLTGAVIGLATCGSAALAADHRDGGFDVWDAADLPLAVEQFLSFGRLPAGFQSAMKGVINGRGEGVPKTKRSTGHSSNKAYFEILADGPTDNPGVLDPAIADDEQRRLLPAFTAKLTPSAKFSPLSRSEPKVALAAVGTLNARTKLEVAPFSAGFEDKTKLLSPKGEPLDKYFSANPLVEKPVPDDPIKIVTTIDGKLNGRTWKLNWANVDYELYAKAVREAKDRSRKDPDVRLVVRAVVDGKTIARPKREDEALAASLLDGDQEPRVTATSYLVRKTFQSGEPTRFRILETSRRQRVQIFSRRAR